MNYSNNIVNTNNNTTNENVIINKVKNSNNNPISKYKTVNDKNFNNTFNNTFNSINKQVIKSKLLYPSKKKNNNNNLNNNINNNRNDNHSTYFTKKTYNNETPNLSYEEEKNKTKDNSKVRDREKIGIYTTKRIDKKNNVKIINGKLEKNNVKNDEIGINEKK